MEATELRLGNFVSIKGDIIRIKAIDFDELYENTPVYFLDGRELERYTPITLTEEWLEKFGLIKKYLENPFEEGGYDLDEKGNKWYYWADNGTFNLEIQTNGEIWFEIYSCYRPIKYVHQLQNLYHALTGEELQLKKENEST